MDLDYIILKMWQFFYLIFFKLQMSPFEEWQSSVGKIYLWKTCLKIIFKVVSFLFVWFIISIQLSIFLN